MTSIFPKSAMQWVLTLSLAVAFAGVALVQILVQHERNFNRTLDPHDLVVQIFTQSQRPGQEPVALGGSLPDLAAALKASNPDLDVARITHSRQPSDLEVGGKNVSIRLDEADASIVDVLNFGDIGEAVRRSLAVPNGAVITRSASRTIFGGDDALNRTFTHQGHIYGVGAVVRDFSQTSSLADIAVLISSAGAWTTIGSAEQAGVPLVLSIGDVRTFVRLPADNRGAIERLTVTADRHAAVVQQRFLVNPAARASSASTLSHVPVRIRHLEDAVEIGGSRNPNRLSAGTIALISLISVVVLIAAALNANGLLMARLVETAPVLAVRRAFGASRISTAFRIVAEGVGGFLIAAVLGCVIAMSVSSAFGSVMGREVDLLPDATTVALLAGGAILTGAVAAAYPAIVGGRFAIAEVLSSRVARIPGATGIRFVLVVLQVAASAAIIVFASIVYQQLSFLQGADLGFDDRNVQVYRLPEPLTADDPRIRTVLTLAQEVGAAAASLSATIPSEGTVGRLQLVGPSGGVVEASVASVDQEYFEVLEVGIISGRPLADRDATVETGARPVVLSADLVAALGFQQPTGAVGTVLPTGGGEQPLIVVGVVPNLPVADLRAPTRPFAVYEARQSAARFLMVREGTSESSGRLSDSLSKIFPNEPIERFTLTDRVRSAFLDVARVRWIASLFSLLALATAAVGVYALAVERVASMRIEVGVRKAFGASGRSVARLLVWRLAPGLAVGSVAGIILGGLAGTSWSDGFARQEIHVVEASVLAIAGIAFATVLAIARQTWRIARLKTVVALRVE